MDIKKQLEIQEKITETVKKRYMYYIRIHQIRLRTIKDIRNQRFFNRIKTKLNIFFFKHFSLKICTSVPNRIYYFLKKLFNG